MGPGAWAVGLLLGALWAPGSGEGFGGSSSSSASDSSAEESSCTIQDADGHWVSCDELLGGGAEPVAPEPAPTPKTEEPDAGSGAAEPPPPEVDVRRFRKQRKVGGPWADAFSRTREEDRLDFPLLLIRREAGEKDLDAKQARADEKAGLLPEAARKRYEDEAARSARVRELIEVLALRRREDCLDKVGKIEVVGSMRLPRRTGLKLSHPVVVRQMAVKDLPECRRIDFIKSEDIETMQRVLALESRLAQRDAFESLKEKKQAEAELAELTVEVRGVIKREPARLETKAVKPEKIKRWGPAEVRKVNRPLRGRGDPDSD